MRPRFNFLAKRENPVMENCISPTSSSPPLFMVVAESCCGNAVLCRNRVDRQTTKLAKHSKKIGWSLQKTKQQLDFQLDVQINTTSRLK